MHYMRFALLVLGLVLYSTQGECRYAFEGFFKEYGGSPWGGMDGRRLDLVAKFLPDDPVIFEAGGHYGDDTVNFVKKWEDATIISFEPNPHAFEKLVEKTKGIENVHSYNLAVHNYNGIATLHVCHGYYGDNPIFEGASSLLSPTKRKELDYQGPKIDVPCVILDDWALENNVDHIDFMWLDLEGVELHVLKSSPRILNTVKVIYTETNLTDLRIGITEFTELRTFLESSGFKLLAHWYYEWNQGDAIFVKKELFDRGFRNPF